MKLSTLSLNKRKIAIQFNGNLINLDWEIKRVRAHGRKVPASIYICELFCDGKVVVGYGESLFPWIARKTAFAESWERFVFTRIELFNKTLSQKFQSTNGFAAGRTTSEAIYKSELELIERKILMEAWSLQIGWAEIRPEGIIQKLFQSSFTQNKWLPKYFRVQTNSDYSLLCLFLISTCGKGVLFDCIAFKSNQEIPIVKLSLSLARAIVLSDVEGLNFGDELPEHGLPKHHGHFYRNDDKKIAFEGIFNGKASDGFVKLNHLDEMKSNIIYNGGDLPPVAVTYNDRWNELSWGKKSIHGHPWPHPLA